MTLTARRRAPCVVCAIALLWLAASALPAQEQPPASRVTSGPVAGSPLHTLRVAALARNGFEETDLAQRLGNGPCAILFVHEFTRPAAQVVRTLDGLGAEFAPFGLQTQAVLLSEDRNSGEQWLQRSRRALGLLRPVCLSVDGMTGPGDYALARNAALTLVVANGGKVVDSVGWTDVGAKDAAFVRSQVERVLPAQRRIADLVASLPDDPAELKRRIGALAGILRHQQMRIRQLQQRRQNQRMQPRARARDTDRPMREGPARDAANDPGKEPAKDPADGRRGQPRPPAGTRRAGRAPSDPELRTLLRSLIQRTNDEAKVKQILGAIETRVGQNEGLRRQAVEMFRLIESLGYGTDAARSAAKAYVAKHGQPERSVDR